MLRSLPTLAVILALATPALAVPPTGGPGGVAPERLDPAVHAAQVAARFGAAAALDWDALRATPRALRRLAAPTFGADPAARARDFLERHRDLLALSPAFDLSLAEVRAHRDGVVVTFTPHLDGLALPDRAITVALDRADLARSVRIDPLDPLPAGLAPAAHDVGPAAAVTAVTERFGPILTGRPTRVVLTDLPGTARVAWRVPVALVPFVAHFFVWVDAASGEVLKQAPAAKDQLITHLEVPR